MSWILWIAAATIPSSPAVDFADLRRQVIPTTVERWETIPWRTDLSAAREGARRQGRLLFLWAMNGHPCGSV